MTALSAERVGRITGSRVASVIGINPYKTGRELMDEMVAEANGEPPSFTGNDATRHGQEYEPVALAMYASRTGQTLEPGRWVRHREHDFLGATPDALAGTGGLVEVKAPYRARYTHILERPDYAAQIHLQMECADRDWTDFVVYRAGKIHVSRVFRDPWWIDEHMPTFRLFIATYRKRVAASNRLSDAQRVKIMATYNGVSRAVRLDSISQLVGRPIGSALELTVAEAAHVIEWHELGEAIDA